VSAIALPASADDDEKPVVLTNEDLERVIRRQQSSPDASGSGLIIVSSPDDEPTEPREAPRRSAPAPAARSAHPYSGPAGSWQEEYYRLKALALERQIERGDEIDFGDGAGHERAPSAPDEAEAAPAASSSPSCIYGSKGALVYAPEGVQCRPHRRFSAPTLPAGGAAMSQGSCVYDRQGKLLHEPAGRSCRD
jgi:hypothetical protein